MMRRIEYKIKKRKARVIPFGYNAHDDKRFLVPVPEQLDALREAKKYIEQKYPWRSVRDWLVRTTGREISLMGLRLILKNRRIEADAY